nr:hypothetical protein [Ningiella sp. W23]
MKIESSTQLSQSLAIDPTHLENITGNSEAGVKQAAEQFEAIFYSWY